MKEAPNSHEIIQDYAALLHGLLLTLTELVDGNFQDADFLHRDHIEGSTIEKETKLSFIIRTIFGLGQMALRSELVKNYQQTLKSYLVHIKHNANKKVEYANLLNIINTYQSLAKAIVAQEKLKKELLRLTCLDLPPKTIDRYLQIKFDSWILEPVAALTAQIAKMMRSSKQLQSDTLAGHSNSLASLSKLAATSSEHKRQKHSKHSATQQASKTKEKIENKLKHYSSSSAAAA